MHKKGYAKEPFKNIANLNLLLPGQLSVKEMKKNIAITFLVGIMIGLVMGCSYFPTKWQETHSKKLAYSYLANSYNTTLGLCYENPENKNFY